MPIMSIFILVSNLEYRYILFPCVSNLMRIYAYIYIYDDDKNITCMYDGHEIYIDNGRLLLYILLK